MTPVPPVVSSPSALRPLPGRSPAIFFARLSIRTQLVFWCVTVLACALVTMGIILHYTVRASLINGVDQDLKRRNQLGTQYFKRAFEQDHVERLFPVPPVPISPAEQQDPNALGSYLPRLFDLQGQSFFLSAAHTLQQKFQQKSQQKSQQIGKANEGPQFPGKSRETISGSPYNSNALVEVPWDLKTLREITAGHDKEGIFTQVAVNGQPFRVYSMPIIYRGQLVGVMQAGHSLSETYRSVDALSHTLLLLIPVAILLVGSGAMFLAGRLLHPVREITEAADSIHATELSRRLAVSGNDEFSRLASTLNEMLSRLEEAFEQQRRFISDASHELRTPLTAIKAQTSLALLGPQTTEEYRRAMERADRSATTMMHLLQDLLLLSRSDADLCANVFARDRLELQEILIAATESLTHQAHAPILLPSSEEGRWIVQGDRSALTRVFINLLENSIRHTPLDGQIKIRVFHFHPDGLSSTAGEMDDRKVRIVVEDTGIGIPSEHLPHVCKRFYRVDQARTRQKGGTGLGLAICLSIIEAHGGTLTLDSTLGTGTSVTITLPVITNSLITNSLITNSLITNSLITKTV